MSRHDKWKEDLVNDLDEFSNMYGQMEQTTSQIAAMLREQVEHYEKQQRRELGLFLSVVLIVISLYGMMIFTENLYYFLYIQGVAIIVMPIILIQKLKSDEIEQLEGRSDE